MIKKTIVCCSTSLILLGFGSGNLSGQIIGNTNVGVGVGVLSFNGDVGKSYNLSSYSKTRIGYHLAFEQRFGSFLGVAAEGLMGKLAANELVGIQNKNFESDIFQGALKLNFHFDRSLRLDENAVFGPYFFIGAGYLKFDPYGDLKAANSATYQYWMDGSIRDLPENAQNANVNARILNRDYVYETQLTDSLKAYNRNTIVFPLGGGINLKLHNRVEVNLGFAYHFTMSDYMDNVASGKNDSYLYTSVGVQVNLHKGNNDKSRFADVKYKDLDKADTDGDGVRDLVDNCQDTPKGVAVDDKGCPKDDDKDGVPNNIDKEPNSLAGSVVDEFGVTQTDEMLAKKMEEWENGALDRSKAFNQLPSAAYLKAVEEKAKQNFEKTGVKKKLPTSFKPADYNDDEYVSSEEIDKAINDFFDGTTELTAERINELIDFFFEQ